MSVLSTGRQLDGEGRLDWYGSPYSLSITLNSQSAIEEHGKSLGAIIIGDIRVSSSDGDALFSIDGGMMEFDPYRTNTARLLLEEKLPLDPVAYVIDTVITFETDEGLIHYPYSAAISPKFVEKRNSNVASDW